MDKYSQVSWNVHTLGIHHIVVNHNAGKYGSVVAHLLVTRHRRPRAVSLARSLVISFSKLSAPGEEG